MLAGLMGPGSKIQTLKEGLDASNTRVRLIAQRVANASTPSFAETLRQAQQPAGGPADPTAALEGEMTHLADEQIRFEAIARLLQGSYKGLRNAIRER